MRFLHTHGSVLQVLNILLPVLFFNVRKYRTILRDATSTIYLFRDLYPAFRLRPQALPSHSPTSAIALRM